mgnify:CR=1 FL=1
MLRQVPVSHFIWTLYILQVRTLLESKHAVEVRIGEVNTHITILEKELDEKNQVIRANKVII